VQSHPGYPTLKAIDEVLNKYNRWEHINYMARDFILTSLTTELCEKLQDFTFASDMLEYLDVSLGNKILFLNRTLIPRWLKLF
jgi:hypothetical protein